MDVAEEAISFVKKNKKEIIKKFADSSKHKAFQAPISFFMAGSPGAGKTEVSKYFIDLVEKSINQKAKEEGLDESFTIVRIDGDEIREMLPGYTGTNSHLFQGAISKGVNQLYDYVLDKKFNALVDGTFSSEKYAMENIKRSIDKNRRVNILYVYQDPLKAWELTRAREAKEGRMISLDVFVDDFFKAKENVNKVKKLYGNKIEVDFIQRDFEKNIIKFEINIDSIDSYLNIDYTKDSLMEKLKKFEI